MKSLVDYRMAAKAAAGLILIASTVTASIANAGAVCTNYCSAALCSTYTTSLSCTMAAVLSDSTTTLTETPTDTLATKCYWDISKEGGSCQTTSSAQTIPCCAPKKYRNSSGFLNN